VDLKSRIVHPHGATTPDGYADQPLTKSRNGGQPMRQHMLQLRGIESLTGIEQA